jgi:hypothetical protein
MNKLALALLASAFAAPSLAQAPTVPPLPPITVAPWINALRDDALANDHYAWDLTEGLTTEVGQRAAGTAAEARARDWSVAKLKAMGFANVRVEPFDMPVWVRGEEKAWITAPFPQPLAITALGNSAATPATGIEAELVGFNTLQELEATPDSAVRGKIVFVSHAMPRAQDGAGYG